MKHLKKIKIKKKHIIIAVILCVLAPIIFYCGRLVYLLYLDPTPTFVSSPQEDPSTRPAGIPDPEASGIQNIVLFGVDSRNDSDQGRTDSIIIATIDQSSQVIKLTSVMRDMYVEMGNSHDMNRINAAYSLGGPELALKTLNKNLGLDLKYYAIIDFSGFQELVDDMDGIDVNVKPNEVNEINKYILEVNGKNSTLLQKSGFQHLNGQQALSYARIRHVGDGDYERTERQRTVLTCLFQKAKEVSILKVPDLITTLASYIQTNMPLSKVLDLGLSAYKFGGGIQQMRIPVDGYYEDQNVYGAAVLVPDINANAMFVKEFIYNIKFASNKDMPAYMQNNFHMDDGENVVSKPKPNIPNYNTPQIPPKSEDEEEASGVQPGNETGTNPGTTTGTQPGNGTGTNPSGNSGTNGGQGNGTDSSQVDGSNTEGNSGTTPATP